MLYLPVGDFVSDDDGEGLLLGSTDSSDETVKQKHNDLTAVFLWQV